MIKRSPTSRRLAHWGAGIIGIPLGMYLFGSGLSALFVANRKDTWLSITAGLAGMLALLPLSIVGIFKPRFAAFGVLCSLGVFMVSFSVDGFFYAPQRIPLSELPLLLLGFLGYAVPFCAVAGLLLYASGRDVIPPGNADGGHAPPDAGRGGGSPSAVKRLATKLAGVVAAGGRKSQARWGAVILGLVAGGWRFRWGVFSLVRSIRVDDWVGVAGISAMALSLLPLSLLAVFKPRAAAYAAVVSLAVALAYPLILFHPPQFGASEIFGGMFWDLLFDFPLALVAALLLYASAGPNRQA